MPFSVVVFETVPAGTDVFVAGSKVDVTPYAAEHHVGREITFQLIRDRYASKDVTTTVTPENTPLKVKLHRLRAVDRDRPKKPSTGEPVPTELDKPGKPDAVKKPDAKKKPDEEKKAPFLRSDDIDWEE